VTVVMEIGPGMLGVLREKRKPKKHPGFLVLVLEGVACGGCCLTQPASATKTWYNV